MGASVVFAWNPFAAIWFAWMVNSPRRANWLRDSSTIWDRIADTGGAVTGRYYFQDLPTLGLWADKYIPISRHIEHFFADAAHAVGVW